MDKQTNKVTDNAGVPSAILPVNTRTIGAPEGIYILYLEDYVYTFLKKLLPDKKAKNAFSEEIFENASRDVALYGRRIEENGRCRIVVSGAAQLEGRREKIKKYNDTYFPSCTFIGSAYISLNKDIGLRIELTLQNTKVILDDFYVYYDQNEEMQNYLVEWNASPASGAGQQAHVRKDFDDAARLGRIAQAYNREEAKVSFMWNVMNVMCLGFVVCVMAYGIISVNNYTKMQSMQSNIEYCMNFIAQNTSLDLAGKGEAAEVTAIQQGVQDENQKARKKDESQPETGIAETLQNVKETAAPLETAVPEAVTAPEAAAPEAAPAPEMSAPAVAPAPEAIAPEAVTAPLPPDDAVQALADTGGPSEQSPQYYIVQPGDTLRNICYSRYGDYSRVDEICRYNNIQNPDNILYGQRLLLP